LIQPLKSEGKIEGAFKASRSARGVTISFPRMGASSRCPGTQVGYEGGSHQNSGNQEKAGGLDEEFEVTEELKNL
jgi:hypothetical protein